MWAYKPHPADSTQGEQQLPLVVLMAGQFHESMSLSRELDSAIETGVIPPVAVCSPGVFRGDTRRGDGATKAGASTTLSSSTRLRDECPWP